jgi:uncharacterized membrane protein
MVKGRVEAFSDGVIAIIITIMVLELKAPHGARIADLKPMLPSFLSYVLSFVYVGIYWNNHHHMFQSVKSVNGAVLWANLHLLFWLSMVPFATSWMGENPLAVAPVAFYGVVLLMNSIAYMILIGLLARLEGPDSVIAKAMGRDVKGKLSTALYVLGVLAAFIQPIAALTFYVAVALIWLIPDRRFERQLGMDRGRHG